MNKLQLDCFLTTARTGSLSQTSEEMFLTPQAVSKNILNLEKEINTVLFNREHTGVTLTEKGKLFYDYAVKSTDLYQNAIKKIGDYYSGISSSLRIGISEYVNIIGEISHSLAAFRDSHKDIILSGQQYKNMILLEKVEKNELDVAIMNEQQIFSDGNFIFKPFAREDLRLYISSPDTINYPSDLESPELTALCKDLTHVSSSYGIWDRKNWEDISHRVTAFMGYDYEKHFEADNFRSVILNLKTLPCSAVSDARFGYIQEDSGIFNIPLNVVSHLCCLWYRKNENSLITDFVNFMIDYYKTSDDKQEA